MKTIIGTSLSLVGVVVAGSAAAMVNAQVLRGGSDSVTSVPPLAPSVPTVTPAATTTTVASTEVVYRVGDCGVVTVDASEGVLSLVSVVPNPGWEVQVIDPGTTGALQVRFAAWGVEVTMTATLVDGVIVPSVSTGVIEAIGDDGGGGAAVVSPTAPAMPASSASATTPSSRPEVGDDERDDDGEDEHEDEHDEDHEKDHDDD